MTTAFRRLLSSAILLLAAIASTVAVALEPPYVVVDADDGAVLGQRDSGELWYPASLTKLMTVYIVFNALREGRLALDSPVVVSERANTAQPSRMGFPAGTVITIDTALKILIVKSANDIAIAVAETIGGSEASFVAEMNRQAARLGLTGTRFVNPHGLPAQGQSTTARDMALLALTIWNQFPEYRPYFGIPSIRLGQTIMPAGNSLLEYYAGTNGMKTGYICSSGFNLVATATRGGETVLVVVLGEASPESRAITAATLFDAAFQLEPSPARINLPAYRPVATTAAPADLRSEMCPDTPGVAATELIDSDAVLVQAIGPRLPVRDPVVIFTGGANMNARIQVHIPLPRPRPDPYPRDALGVINPGVFAGVPLPRPRPL